MPHPIQSTRVQVQETEQSVAMRNRDSPKEMSLKYIGYIREDEKSIEMKRKMKTEKKKSKQKQVLHWELPLHRHIR